MVCVGGGAKLVEDKCYFSKFLQIHFNIKFQSLMRRMFFPSSIGRAPFSWEICGLLQIEKGGKTALLISAVTQVPLAQNNQYVILG